MLAKREQYTDHVVIQSSPVSGPALQGISPLTKKIRDHTVEARRKWAGFQPLQNAPQKWSGGRPVVSNWRVNTDAVQSAYKHDDWSVATMKLAYPDAKTIRAGIITVVLIPINGTTTYKPHILLVKERDRLLYENGMSRVVMGKWGFCKGSVQNTDVSLRQTAQREFHEEMGVFLPESSIVSNSTHKGVIIEREIAHEVLVLFWAFFTLDQFTKFNTNELEIEDLCLANMDELEYSLRQRDLKQAFSTPTRDALAYMRKNIPMFMKT